MKKWMSLLLAVMMLVATGLVAAEEDYQIYQDPQGRFSFAYPSDWVLQNNQEKEQIISEGMEFVDEEFASSVEANVDNEAVNDMIVLVGPNLMSNINLIPQNAGVTVDSEMLNALAPMVVEMLGVQLPGVEFAGEPLELDVNGNPALMLEYSVTISGIAISGVQVYMALGSTLYTATLTTTAESLEADSEILGFILGSLTEL